MISSALMLIINGKSASFIYLNSYHPFYLNVFFINYTFIGDGIFAICSIVLLLFYFKRKQLGIVLLMSFLISGLAAQIIKNLINSPRPKLFFEAGQYLYFIDGVTLSNNASFPSGHTATAFAIATVLALMMKNKKLQLLILFAAALAGYSRIYLAQHFLLDVIIGAIIGSASGVLSFYVGMNIQDIKLAIRKMQGAKTTNIMTSPNPVQTA